MVIIEQNSSNHRPFDQIEGTHSKMPQIESILTNHNAWRDQPTRYTGNLEDQSPSSSFWPEPIEWNRRARTHISDGQDSIQFVLQGFQTKKTVEHFRALFEDWIDYHWTQWFKFHWWPRRWSWSSFDVSIKPWFCPRESWKKRKQTLENVSGSFHRKATKFPGFVCLHTLFVVQSRIQNAFHPCGANGSASPAV